MTNEHLNWLAEHFIKHGLQDQGITFEQFVDAYKGGNHEWYLKESTEKKTVRTT